MKLDMLGRMRIFDWRNTRSNVHFPGELTRHNIGGLRSYFNILTYLVIGYIITKIFGKINLDSGPLDKRVLNEKRTSVLMVSYIFFYIYFYRGLVYFFFFERTDCKTHIILLKQ